MPLQQDKTPFQPHSEEKRKRKRELFSSISGTHAYHHQFMALKISALYPNGSKIEVSVCPFRHQMAFVRFLSFSLRICPDEENKKTIGCHSSFTHSIFLSLSPFDRFLFYFLLFLSAIALANDRLFQFFFSRCAYLSHLNQLYGGLHETE